MLQRIHLYKQSNVVTKKDECFRAWFSTDQNGSQVLFTQEGKATAGVPNRNIRTIEYGKESGSSDLQADLAVLVNDRLSDGWTLKYRTDEKLDLDGPLINYSISFPPDQEMREVWARMELCLSEHPFGNCMSVVDRSGATETWLIGHSRVAVKNCIDSITVSAAVRSGSIADCVLMAMSCGRHAGEAFVTDARGGWIAITDSELENRLRLQSELDVFLKLCYRLGARHAPLVMSGGPGLLSKCSHIVVF